MSRQTSVRGAFGSLTGFLRGLHRDEAGQDLIEYALIACLIALSAVASMKGIGGKLVTMFTNISTTVTSAI